MGDLTEAVRSYWDLDAKTYDGSASHHPRTAAEQAAWSASLRRLLPSPPAKVLDAGAGTGFVSILLARQGYTVTALDLAPGMLARLQEKARDADLEVQTIEGDATDPPRDNFDAVVERHLLWTLPDPGAALNGWHEAAPGGRLVLLEGLWGAQGGYGGQLRSTCQALLRRVRGEGPDHHAEYDPEVRARLPLGSGATPERLVTLVESSTWGAARLERLWDVEWATRQALPTSLDRLIGVAPRFAVVAG
jgi:SAM-dependent methyltransferase